VPITPVLAGDHVRSVEPGWPVGLKRHGGVASIVSPRALAKLQPDIDRMVWVAHGQSHRVAPSAPRYLYASVQTASLAAEAPGANTWWKHESRALAAGAWQAQSAVPYILRRQDANRLAELFTSLAETWRTETIFASAAQAIVLHPAYQRIIGLGYPAVPLILRELRERPSHWFPALTAITGEDPADSNIDFNGRVQAWLAWGRARGYL
jgi:hypothetical protein